MYKSNFPLQNRVLFFFFLYRNTQNAYIVETEFHLICRTSNGKTNFATLSDHKIIIIIQNENEQLQETPEKST